MSRPQNRDQSLQSLLRSIVYLPFTFHTQLGNSRNHQHSQQPKPQTRIKSKQPQIKQAKHPANTSELHSAERARRGNLPRGPLSAPIEKRPPRARRPTLPQPRAAVLSAKAGLTAGFGMGPGDPRLCGRARGGRSPAALSYSSLPGTPVRGDPGGRMAGTDEDHASRSVL